VCAMDEVLAYWNQVPESIRALVVLFAALVLFVIVGRWAARHLREAWRRRQAPKASNVVPLRRPRLQTRSAVPRTRGARGTVNPLGLVLLAVGLAVLFRSGIWTEFTPNETLTGMVTHVRDGDTIEVNRRPIRLNGLTCDERGTPLGNQATAAMRQLVAGKTVTCKLNGDRTYDREVGRCSLVDGRDVGAVMIAKGLCGRCARYDPLRKYIAVQREAGAYEGDYPGYCWALW